MIRYIDLNLEKYKSYKIRPTVCHTYPISGRAVIFAGYCEYMIRYLFEKSKGILIKCLSK